MPLGPDDPYWKKLYEVLSDLARSSGGVFAFVIDDGNGLWCVGLADTAPPTVTKTGDLAAGRFYTKEIIPRAAAMRRGKPFDVAVVDGEDRYVGVSFAGIYVAVVWFEGELDAQLVRARIRRVLPLIEALTFDLPPSGGPTAGGGKMRA